MRQEAAANDKKDAAAAEIVNFKITATIAAIKQEDENIAKVKKEAVEKAKTRAEVYKLKKTQKALEARIKVAETGVTQLTAAKEELSKTLSALVSENSLD